jgi:hypothetical protein
MDDFDENQKSCAVVEHDVVAIYGGMADRMQEERVLE